MIIKTISGDEDINLALNAAKESVINTMISEGIISGEVGERFCKEYFVVIADKKGIFARLFSKSDEHNSKIITVKIP